MLSRRTRSWVAALAVGLVLAGSAACSSSPPTSTSSGGSTATLKFYNDKNFWSKYFQTVQAKGAEETGVHVKDVNLPSTDNYVAFVKSTLQTSVKPDLVSWAIGSQTKDLVKVGGLQDLTGVWNEALKKGDIQPALRQYYTVDGKEYGVPLYTSYWVMFYRKDTFKRLGLTVPTTWKDMMNDAAAAKTAGIKPFYQVGNVFAFVWFQTLLAAHDPQLYRDLVSGKASYTDPGVIEVMKQWKNLIDQGYMSDSTSTVTAAQMLKDDKVAMVPFGTFYSGDVKVAGLNPAQWGVFKIPVYNDSVTKAPIFFETGGVSVMAGAKHVADSIKYAQWWTSASAQTVWAQQLGDLSPNPKVAPTNPSYAQLAKSLGDNDLLLRFYEAAPADVLTAVNEGLASFMVKPDTYMSVLQNIQDVNKNYWKSKG